MLWSIPNTGIWNPWAEMRRLQRDMDRVFDRAADRGTGDFPAVNILTSENDAVLAAELPGIDAKDLEITVKNDTVTIRGSRKQRVATEGETYLRRERGAGNFVRSFSLPYAVDADKVTAQYENGILRVSLPRAEADKPKRIAVTAA